MVAASGGCYVLDTLTLVSIIFSAAPIIHWPSDNQPDHHLFCCVCVCVFYLLPQPLWHPAPLCTVKRTRTQRRDKWLITAGRCSDPWVAERVSLGSTANDPADSVSSPLNWSWRGVQGAAGEANAALSVRVNKRFGGLLRSRRVSAGFQREREPSLLLIWIL